MGNADYYADVYDGERDYYLDCGCWSGQADHTCRVGGWVRPAYCRCGAPDDCYCNEDGRHDDDPPPPDTDEVHVTVEYDGETWGSQTFRMRRTVPLPRWCEGEPLMAAALYLFGYAGAIGDVRMTLVEVR